MTKTRWLIVKLTIFGVVMLLINGALIMVFAQVRGGASQSYHAVFSNATGLKAGDKVRIAGVAVGSVSAVEFGDDGRAHVGFSLDTADRFDTDTKANIRYEDLVGNRYLELLEGAPTSDTIHPGGTIGLGNTAPALDLDALLGGFHPLFEALAPKQVNDLSMSLLEIFQGRSGTIADVLTKAGTVTAALADRDQLIGQVITNLNTVLAEITSRGDQFSSTLDHLQQLVSGLAVDRDTIGHAIDSLNTATGTFADLLVQDRPDIAGTVRELNYGLTDSAAHPEILDQDLARMPGNYRKMIRNGAYGSFFNFYLCGIAIKLTGVDGRPLTVDLIEQKTGRCAPLK